MKRIQEKVKDIVEVRTYKSLSDFTVDPALTLSNYHFTDATAELMTKWLDRIADVQGRNGSACALAGYRGVGKSHFMATLGAIVSHPELRSRVSDSHVSTGAQRLLRRHYPVVYVRRGIRETLTDEFRDAIAAAFDLEVSSLGGSLTDILNAACQKAGDLPFVLMIDTAFERGSRVTRDDGPFLSEIAEASKNANVFLGVALDDDIAGADGSNSAIARSFTIDYLDQEHLYKVVNAHVFPKNSQMQPVLHDIYNYFREVLPNFRWSEQRFSSLYPLHPAILEVAPFVRLYVHDFALLGFAAEAGERILGRPANSLIALDEVFDNAEKGLRKIDDLAEAFAAYDKLNAEVVGKIPVINRLQAKLVLKALLLLSLDGRGTTAGEISAGMLIFEESEPEKSVKTVEDLIKTFTDALPDEIQAYHEENREPRYGFKVESKDNLNKALAAAITDEKPEVVPYVLHGLMQDRFSDCTFYGIDGAEKDSMDCQIVWRGGFRRGRIFWNDGRLESTYATASHNSEHNDWEIIIDLSKEPTPAASDNAEVSKVFWKPDDLRRDEIETILRYFVLSTNTELREQFGDQIRASLHSHTVSVEKIFNRSFLEDGKLVIESFDYNFSEEARTTTNLSDLFSMMLEPLFETRYPSHPYFSQKLGVAEVATLVSDLYDGSKQHLAEVQNLARTFALPLGIVKDEGGILLPETAEGLASLPMAAEILQRVGDDAKGSVLLKDIYASLKRPPNGLVREAQHLLLTALVAQRQIEFVTSKGDRINRRSLDLKIIWDDIVGVAKPIDSGYSAKKLARWAAVFAGEGSIKSFDTPQEHELLKSAFSSWIDEWNAAAVLTRFNELPDDLFNVRIWRLAAYASKTMGSVAESIKACLSDSISPEECLTQIADAFLDSTEEMDRAKGALGVVESFVKSSESRRDIKSYLALCDYTGNADTEEIRDKLVRIVEMSFREPSEANNRETGYLWAKFQREFSEHFAVQHDIVMKSHALQERYDNLKRGDRWWEYKNLSETPLIDAKNRRRVDNLHRLLEELDCKADVREALKSRPFCICSFSLGKVPSWESLPENCSEAIELALQNSYERMAEQKAGLIPLLEKLASGTGDKAVADLVKELRSSGKISSLTPLQVSALKHALQPPKTEERPKKNSEKTKTDKRRESGQGTENELAVDTADEAVLMNI